MAFIIEKSLIGSENQGAIELIEGTESESYEAGEALTLSSGELTKCGATVKPSFISAKK